MRRAFFRIINTRTLRKLGSSSLLQREQYVCNPKRNSFSCILALLLCPKTSPAWIYSECSPGAPVLMTVNIKLYQLLGKLLFLSGIASVFPSLSLPQVVKVFSPALMLYWEILNKLLFVQITAYQMRRFTIKAFQFWNAFLFVLLQVFCTAVGFLFVFGVEFMFWAAAVSDALCLKTSYLSFTEQSQKIQMSFGENALLEPAPQLLLPSQSLALLK